MIKSNRQLTLYALENPKYYYLAASSILNYIDLSKLLFKEDFNPYLYKYIALNENFKPIELLEGILKKEV